MASRDDMALDWYKARHPQSDLLDLPVDDPRVDRLMAALFPRLYPKPVPADSGDEVSGTS